MLTNKPIKVKKIRKDKIKSIAKVAKVVLANPLLTRDEIAIKAGVAQGTVSNVVKELDAAGRKDERIIGITDKDLENIREMQALVTQKIRNPEEMSTTRISELAQVMKEATARYSLFRGNATDDEGGLKEISEITIL